MKMKQFLLLLFVQLLMPILAFGAEEFEVNRVRYTVNDDGNSVTVAVHSGYNGTLNIPETVRNEATGRSYAVTAIGDNAFAENPISGDLVIPNGVKSIGE